MQYLSDIFRLEYKGRPARGLLRVQLIIVGYVAPVLGLVGLLLIGLYATQSNLSNSLGDAVGFAGSLVLLTAPLIAAALKNVEATGLMLVAMIWLASTTGAAVTDGIHAPQILTLIQLPIWAAFFGGRRSAIITLVIVIATFLILLFYGPSNLSIQNAIASVGLAGPSIIVAVLAIITASTVLILVYIESYLQDDLLLSRQQAENANRAKTEFLYSMSHELRTPLNAIIGFSQLLEMEKEKSPDEAVSRAANHIHDAGQHLLSLIEDLLDIAALEEGKIDLDFSPVRPSEVIDEITPLIKNLASEKALSLEFLDECPKYIRVDRRRFKQVLLNFASNAIKYNREGGAVEFGSALNEEGNALVHVRDTGLGIPEPDQPQIFQRFARASHTKNVVKGSGLGLYHCKELVEKMGGRISFTSSKGAGSTFFMEFPIVEDPVDTSL